MDCPQLVSSAAVAGRFSLNHLNGNATPSNATEEVFLFSKAARYYYDNRAVREESGANLRNYWLLGPDADGSPHPATFPRELARRCILLGSRPGDLILDPFSGSGTTGVAALELNRRAVLIELVDDYVAQARERLGGAARRDAPADPAKD